MDKIEDLSIKSEDAEKFIRSFSNNHFDQNATEEEFQNFMHRVTEVEKIVKKLASTDANEQERGMLLADKMLDKNTETQITEIGELKVKTNRTQINKYSLEETDPNKMSQEAFKRSIERDAQQRAENRKARNERADTYKRIGNAAFKEGNYEKAVTYFSKAVEHRKDSSVLWNNRALSYMKLGQFEKALLDYEWALKVNDANIKALLNSAKCHKSLGNYGICKEFIARAREKNPHFQNYISEFEKSLETESESRSNQDTADDLID